MTPVTKPDGVRELQPVDAGRLKALVGQISEEVWAMEDAGKENRFGCFHHTRHIIFRFMEMAAGHRAFYDRPLWQAWQGHLMPLMLEATASYQFQAPVFPKVMLARLAAGYGIDRHVDNAKRNLYTHKIHVPLQTSDKVRFTVGDGTFHLREGFAYEVNNLQPHAVVNDGDVDRIHLIFEVFEGQE